jgi:hypothetical protein
MEMIRAVPPVEAVVVEMTEEARETREHHSKLIPLQSFVLLL